MHIILGLYYFLPKRLAYRNDYCFSCAQPQRAIRVRTLDVLHILYIPLLPVALTRRWQCEVCGKDPHERTATSRTMKWLGLGVLVILSLASWATIIRGAVDWQEPDDSWHVLLVAAGASVGALLTLRHLRRTPPETPLKKLLAEIPPATEIICPYCGMPMVLSSAWKCSGCGIERASLPN